MTKIILLSGQMVIGHSFGGHLDKAKMGTFLRYVQVSLCWMIMHEMVEDHFVGQQSNILNQSYKMQRHTNDCSWKCLKEC